MVFDKLKGFASQLTPTEPTFEEKLGEIKSSVEEFELERPFDILISMSSEERRNIRSTLDFKWGKDTLKADDELKPFFESWEILDCNIKGIISRLHSISEQLNPNRYNGWRQTLTRILDLSGIHYNAAESEEKLEKLVLHIFDESTRISKKQDSTIPTSGAAKLGKSVGMAAAIIKDVGAIWDDVLGSEDEPAMNAVYAICAHIHKPLDSDDKKLNSPS